MFVEMGTPVDDDLIKALIQEVVLEKVRTAMGEHHPAAGHAAAGHAVGEQVAGPTAGPTAPKPRPRPLVTPRQHSLPEQVCLFYLYSVTCPHS